MSFCIICVAGICSFLFFKCCVAVGGRWVFVHCLPRHFVYAGERHEVQAAGRCLKLCWEEEVNRRCEGGRILPFASV